jgi:protocatechuate 3,4-dioxygenase alpha subunit
MAEQLGLTPAQTVGPFLHIALADPAARSAVPADDDGAFTVGGRVLDGNGDAVPDAVVETWQSDGHFGRCPTDDDGRWEIRTVKPPVVSTRDGTPQAPHLVVSVFARGLLDRVVTRIYFGDETEANAADPTLATLGDHRRHLLVAAGNASDGYRFDIRLQGDDESVFFAI